MYITLHNLVYYYSFVAAVFIINKKGFLGRGITKVEQINKQRPADNSNRKLQIHPSMLTAGLFGVVGYVRH